MIGANAEAIDKAEDRQKFRDAMTGSAGKPALGVAIHGDAPRRWRLSACRDHPAVLHLGGTGGGIAYNREEFDRDRRARPRRLAHHRGADRGVVLGWKEYEMEVVRDKNGQRASSSARSRTSTRWACTPATRSPSRRRRR
jgi:carbamoyl-phosphate synthase large subunit